MLLLSAHSLVKILSDFTLYYYSHSIPNARCGRMGGVVLTSLYKETTLKKKGEKELYITELPYGHTLPRNLLAYET